MAAPPGHFQSDIRAQLRFGFRKAGGRKKGIIGRIHHQRRHPYVLEPVQRRTVGPIVSGISETMQGRGITVVKLLEVAYLPITGNIDKLRKTPGLVLHLALQPLQETLHIDTPARSTGTEYTIAPLMRLFTCSPCCPR